MGNRAKRGLGVRVMAAALIALSGACVGAFGQGDVAGEGLAAAPPERPVTVPGGVLPEEEAPLKFERQEDGTIRLGEIVVDPAARQVRFPAEVNTVSEHLEYLIVTKLGNKTHEALLRTEVSPLHLQAVLVLLKFRPSVDGLLEHVGAVPAEDGGEEVGEDEEEGSNGLAIYVRLAGEEGGEADLIPVRDWLIDLEKQGPLAGERWLFTGSEPVEGRFGALIDGVHGALYIDSRAVINCGHPNNLNDQVWYPNAERVPVEGTAVEVVIGPEEADEG